jgi:hypothetical protein
MTSDEVKSKMNEALAKDEEADKDHKGIPISSLLTAVVLGGKDTTSATCPVFALQLRTDQGRYIADQMKDIMKGLEHD